MCLYMVSLISIGKLRDLSSVSTELLLLHKNLNWVFKDVFCQGLVHLNIRNA